MEQNGKWNTKDKDKNIRLFCNVWIVLKKKINHDHLLRTDVFDHMRKNIAV
jgi:hypothetical protein